MYLPQTLSYDQQVSSHCCEWLYKYVFVFCVCVFWVDSFVFLCLDPLGFSTSLAFCLVGEKVKAQWKKGQGKRRTKEKSTVPQLLSIA
jgi:hypothetical protein